jgi:hypothetical protein
MTNRKYEHEPVEEFVFEDWLRDRIKGVRSKVEHRMKGEGMDFDTSEFRMHMRMAGKEQLLAMRSLLDNAIDWLDKKEESPKQEAKNRSTGKSRPRSVPNK